MGNIPKGFVKYADRKIMKQGSSAGITLPTTMSGVELGKIVSIYINGEGLVLIDLAPE